jgi:hypothetical protein
MTDFATLAALADETGLPLSDLHAMTPAEIDALLWYCPDADEELDETADFPFVDLTTPEEIRPLDGRCDNGRAMPAPFVESYSPTGTDR